MMIKLTISLSLSICLLFISCGQKKITTNVEAKTKTETEIASNTEPLIKRGTRFVLKVNAPPGTNPAEINAVYALLEKRLQDAKFNYNPPKIDAPKNEITFEVASNLNNPKKVELLRQILIPVKKTLQLLPCYRNDDPFVKEVISTGELAQLGLGMYPMNERSYPSFIGTVSNENQKAAIVAFLQQNIAEKHMAKYYWKKDGGTHFLHIVDARNPLLSEKSIERASQQVNQYSGTMEVGLAFTAEGAKKFAKLTKQCAADNKRAIAIIVDDVLMSAPIVQEAITGGKASISGNFTKEEAQIIAMNLSSGDTPFEVILIEENAMGEGNK